MANPWRLTPNWAFLEEKNYVAAPPRFRRTKPDSAEGFVPRLGTVRASGKTLRPFTMADGTDPAAEPEPPAGKKDEPSGIGGLMVRQCLPAFPPAWRGLNSTGTMITDPRTLDVCAVCLRLGSFV